MVCHGSLLNVIEDVETGKELMDREALHSYVKTARSTEQYSETIDVLYLACKKKKLKDSFFLKPQGRLRKLPSKRNIN